MKNIWSTLLVCTLVFATVDADAARRIGSGGSVGKQSGTVAQRQASPGSPVTALPATAAPTPAATAAPRAGSPAATPPQPPARGVGSLLGGLAAGLGLAWLAQALGFGLELAQFMLFALLALLVMAMAGAVMRRRGAASEAGGTPSQFAFAGAGAPPPDRAAAPRQYSPDKVGNDASARPWEDKAFDAAGEGAAVQAGRERSAPNRAVPAGFDVAAFVQSARRNFLTLQEAWDRSDFATLRSMMTDEMVAELRGQLQQREQQRGGQASMTEVVMLDAQFLGIEDLGDAYMASVEYSGMTREDPSTGPSPFREVWNMTKPKDGSAGWLVAGVQALQ